MYDLREGKIKKVEMITDFLGAIIMGHASYEVISMVDVSILTTVVWTMFLSANSFLVIRFFTDKDLFEKIMSKYLR